MRINRIKFRLFFRPFSPVVSFLAPDVVAHIRVSSIDGGFVVKFGRSVDRPDGRKRARVCRSVNRSNPWTGGNGGGIAVTERRDRRDRRRRPFVATLPLPGPRIDRWYARCAEPHRALPRHDGFHFVLRHVYTRAYTPTHVHTQLLCRRRCRRRRRRGGVVVIIDRPVVTPPPCMP